MMESFFDTTYPATSPRGASAIKPPKSIDMLRLAAGVAKRHVIPVGAVYVDFSATTDVFCKFGGPDVTSDVPATSDIIDGTAPELNPGTRRIPQDATHLSVMAPSSGQVTLGWFSA